MPCGKAAEAEAQKEEEGHPAEDPHLIEPFRPPRGEEASLGEGDRHPHGQKEPGKDPVRQVDPAGEGGVAKPGRGVVRGGRSALGRHPRREGGRSSLGLEADQVGDRAQGQPLLLGEVGQSGKEVEAPHYVVV